MAMTFKERLQAAMRDYELNRAKLTEYTEELELSLKSAVLSSQKKFQRKSRKMPCGLGFGSGGILQFAQSGSCQMVHAGIVAGK